MAALAWSDMNLKLWENADSVQQREVLDALPLLIFLERAGKIIFANAEARRAMGTAEAEWLQRPLEEIIWGFSAGTAEPQTQLTSTKGTPFHATLAAAGGRMMPLEGTYQVLHSGRSEGVIVAHMSERARNSRPRLMEDVLACIPDALAIVLGRNVMYTNPAFSRMFGFEADEIAGESLRDLIVPETRQHEQASLERMVEERGIAALDTVRKTKDGELVDVALQMAPLIVAGARAGFVCSYRDIGERKQVEARLQQDATHDVLTALPNGLLFRDHLKLALSRQARRSDQRCGVIFLDVDGFRAVNSRVGHAVGDQLLVAISRRLQSTLRPHDTAARLAEDNFAILVENISSVADLETVAGRLFAEFEKPLDVRGTAMPLKASIGAAMAQGDIHTPDSLMANADIALRRAKQHGARRYEIFDRTTDAEVSDQLERERALRQVLAQRGFEYWYQPFFRLASGQVEGFDGLLRWAHADGSAENFSDLLPAAENAGISVSIGRETLQAAWRQLQQWNVAIPANNLVVTVNLTHRQFYHDEMVAQVQQLVGASGADPWQLMFAVSESSVNESPDRAHAILQRLADCGVRIALDNFGAGLGALQHLLRMPLHMLKLDAKLTSTPSPSSRGMALLESILHVAKAAGMQTLAQGIESQEQFRFVQEMGFDLGQGHLLSQPLDARHAEVLAARSRGMVAR